ncbi:hypothetical protein [Microbacterium sp.]|nr:hypothetical protein [Microbacterium sp.]
MLPARPARRTASSQQEQHARRRLRPVSQDFDDLQVGEVDEPKLPPGSVLIEVRAAGV